MLNIKKFPFVYRYPYYPLPLATQENNYGDLTTEFFAKLSRSIKKIMKI